MRAPSPLELNTSASPSPSHVSAVSPVQWMHAFAYTPDTDARRPHARARDNRGPDSVTRLRPKCVGVPVSGVDPEPGDGVPWSEDDDDMLPTRPSWPHFPATSRRVRSSRALGPGGELNPGGNRLGVRGGPSLTVPAKHKWSSRDEHGRKDKDREALSLSTIPDGLAQWHTRKTRSRTRCPSQSESAIGGSGYHTGPGPSHTPASQTQSTVLDAVEIVGKKKTRECVNDPKTIRAWHPTDLHYPSPPVSRTDRDIAGHDGRSHGSHTVTLEREEHATPEPALPLKTSKYFTRTPASPTRSVSERFPVLTPPSSPRLTIPVYIESSDFEYPPQDASFDEPAEGAVDESSVPAWYNNPGLFDDLMIMLRRLKPILVQESVRDDPWKVLVVARLLNVTTGKVAIPVFCKIMSRWPTPQDLAHAPQDELVELLRPLGLYNKRASWLKDVSERFLEDHQAPGCSSTSLGLLLSEERAMPAAPWSHYPGVGPYALDSLRIFFAGDRDAWKHVTPRDKELVRYLRWRWAAEEGKVWYPGRGVIGDVDVPYLITMVDDLAAHYDDAIGGEGNSLVQC